MSDEINIMSPAEELIIKGETITVMPFLFGSFGKVAKLIKQLQPAILANIDDKGNIDILGLLTDGSEGVFDLCALAIKKPRAYFDTISGSDGIAIVAAMITQNKEEFTKKLAPSVSKLVAQVGAAMQIPAMARDPAGEQSTQS